jgi:hypothetical protein
MSILPLFQWAAHAQMFGAIRDSKWGFAIMEMSHLLALALLGGVVLIVNLNILGIGLRRTPSDRLARDLAGVFRGSLILTIVTGLVLVAAEPLKCYYHPAFRLKMALFALAVVFYAVFQRRVTAGASDRRHAPQFRIGAALSLALWLSVGLAGRAIGFF